MANLSLEERVAALEAQVEQIKRVRPNPDADAKPWWEMIYGAFANDPLFDEAMRLGEEYRKSQPLASDEPENDGRVSA